MSDAMTTDDSFDIATLLTDAATRLFATHGAGPGNAGDWSNSLWSALVEAGLTRAAVSEENGGSGLRLATALSLARVAARAGVSLPLGETIIAGWLLDRAGQEVPDVPLCFAASEKSVIMHQQPAWSHRCRVVAVDEVGRVQLVPNRDLMFREGRNLAGEPRHIIACEIVTPMIEDTPPAPSAMHLGALLRAVQLAEAMQVVGEMTAAYASDRKQFGRALTKFQAIQQHLAVQAGEIAAADMAAEMALGSIDTDRFETAVAVAKARTSEAAGKVASIAHQVHGAMGFTREHDLQYFTRRLWSWREEWGNETEWNRSLGAEALSGGADAFWPSLARL